MKRLFRSHSISVNVISNWLVIVLSAAIGLLLTPFIIANLGKEYYGAWTLVGTIVGYFSLLTFGVTTATTRFVARYLGSGNTHSAIETANTALALYTIVGLVAIGISVVAGPILGRFFNMESQIASEFSSAFRLLGLATAATLIGGVSSSILSAQEKFVALNICTILTDILRAIGTIVVLYSGWGLEGVALATAVPVIVKTLATFVLCLRFAPEISWGFRFGNRKTLGSLFGFGLFIWITLLSNILRTQIDSVVLGKFLSLEAVAIYGISYSLIRYLYQAGNTFSTVTSPRLSRIAGTQDDTSFKNSFLKFSETTGYFAFGAGAVCAVVVPAFVELWVGPEFANSSLVFMILLPGIVIDIATSMTYSALVAVDRLKVYAILAILEGVANLILSIVLVRSFGIIGVALGTLIPLVAVRLGFQSLYCCRVIQVNYVTYLYRSLLLPAIPCAIAVLFALALNLGERPTIFRFVIDGTATGSLFLLFAFGLAMRSAQTRELVFKRFPFLSRS